MSELKTEQKNNVSMESAAEVLFNYLRAAIYDPRRAFMDPADLPAEFHTFAKGLMFYCQLVDEVKVLAKDLAGGNLNGAVPSRENEIASPLKSLHASLRHLTWQAQQVAKGDFSQKVDFMGDFSVAFNDMVGKLELRHRESLDERLKLQRHVNLLLANYHGFIMMFDLGGRLAFASESCLEIFGADRYENIINKTFNELFSVFTPESYMPKFGNRINAAINESRTVEFGMDIDIYKKGEPLHFLISVIPVYDARGNNEGVMINLHDVTETVRAKEIAEKALQVRTDFLARMSHEMRTPMNAVMGMAQIYGMSDDPVHKEQCIEKIKRASKHLLCVINDLLDMSQIEANAYEIFSNSFDFYNMVRRVAGDYEFLIEKRRLRFNMDIDRSIPAVVVSDERRLSQLLGHLLANAVKFTPDGGQIDFIVNKISSSGNMIGLRFTVRDNGIGISEENQKLLFLPFEQVDGSLTRKYEGMGLGLAISKRIVEKMQGRIWVESELGKGSAFYFEIDVRAASGSYEDDGTEDNIFAGRKILLAEDIEMNREIVTALLEHTGVEIVQAEDGVAAYEKYAAEPAGYDLIFMDIHMPNMDGYDTTKKIRDSGLPGADKIPVIAMTANVFPEDIERCIEAGMDGHIGKPIDSDLVIGQMKQFILYKTY